MLHCNTARQNKVHFISLANHHAHRQGLVTFRVYTEGVRKSKTNEIDLFKGNNFPVIAAAPHVNIHVIGCNTVLMKTMQVYIYKA